MAKQHKTRQGKVVTAGHSTRIEGLDKFLKGIEDWPEITTIRIGHIKVRNTIGRGGKKLRIKKSTDTLGLPTSTVEPQQTRKRAKGGGGFSFRATRWAVNGSGMHTGIHCNASYGRIMQEVVLTSDDYDALRARLKKEGLGVWEDPDTQAKAS
jgi:hypothetical protein